MDYVVRVYRGSVFVLLNPIALFFFVFFHKVGLVRKNFLSTYRPTHSIAKFYPLEDTPKPRGRICLVQQRKGDDSMAYITLDKMQSGRRRFDITELRDQWQEDLSTHFHEDTTPSPPATRHPPFLFSFSNAADKIEEFGIFDQNCCQCSSHLFISQILIFKNI